MATVDSNIVTKGLRGKIGNIVFRKRGNKTTAYILSERKVPLTKKQKDAQIQFSQAVALARQALADEAGQERFKQMAVAEGKESAYSAAISYFMKNSL